MHTPDDRLPSASNTAIYPQTRSRQDSTLARLERAGPGRGGSDSRMVRLALLGGSGLLALCLGLGVMSLFRKTQVVPSVAVATAPVAVAAARAGRPPAANTTAPERGMSPADRQEDPLALIRQGAQERETASTEVRVAQSQPEFKVARATRKVVLQQAARKVDRPARPQIEVRKTRLPAPVVTVKVEPQQVDTDVALLSAILSQSSRHAADRANAESTLCPDAIAASRRCSDNVKR